VDRAIRLYVPLRKSEIKRLMEVADAERRRPADQAAHMLAQLLAERPDSKSTGLVPVQ
jgi:hypothetical protein